MRDGRGASRATCPGECRVPPETGAPGETRLGRRRDFRREELGSGAEAESAEDGVVQGISDTARTNDGRCLARNESNVSPTRS